MTRVHSDTGNFSLVPFWVLDLDISARALQLYVVLGRWADWDTGDCFPSRRAIAAAMRCSADVVDRAKNELVAAGALIIDGRFSEHGDRTSNEYTVVRAIPQGGGRESAATGRGESAATGGRESAAVNKNQVERQPEERIAAAKERPRDVVWDALLVVCGVNPDRVPDSARGKYNRAVADLKKLDATPVEIEQRARTYRRKWPEVSMTPNALVVHWAECDPQWQHAKVDPKADAVSAAVHATFERLDRERAEAEADEAERRARVREQNRLELEA